MYDVEIIRLQNQINKLKQIYEARKKEREILVKEMNELDKKLEKIEKIKENEQNSLKIINKNKKIKNKLKRTYSKIGLVAIIIVLMTDTIFLGFSKILQQLLFTLGINIIGYKIAYNKHKEKNIVNNSNLNLIKIEKEYQIIKEKRINIGQKYKNIREKEVSAYNIYKTIEKIVNDKINYINSIHTTKQTTLNNIEFNDIYHKITSYWNEYFKDYETTKKVLDNQLKRYLIEKIININNNNTLKEYLEELEVEELVTILGTCIPKCNHSKTLSHIIHAVLGYASNMQSYSIVWLEEQDKSLIDEPIITFDKFNKWDKLITHKNTDYITIFNKVYNTFKNEFMLKDITKKRKKLI